MRECQCDLCKKNRKRNEVKKPLSLWVRQNRKEIDEAILRICSGMSDTRINDEERRLWILNDESLYLWAKREGVKV